MNSGDAVEDDPVRAEVVVEERDGDRRVVAGIHVDVVSVKVLLGLVHASAAHCQRRRPPCRHLVLQRRPQHALDRLQQRL